MRVFVAEVLPSPQEIDFYNRNGWLLTDLVVSDECLQMCSRAAEEIYAGRYDEIFEWSRQDGNVSFGQPYTDRSEMRYDAYISHHKVAVREVVRSPHLGRYAAALLDTDEVRLYRDMMLTVPGGTNHHTGWHVDKNYWPTVSSEKLTTAWFSLEDCNEKQGCLVVVNASHAWRKTTFIRKIALGNLEQLSRLYARDPEEIQVTCVPHKRGQISFHNCRLIHGSMPNESNVLRQSFVIGLQDGENHYVEATDADNARLAVFNTNDRIGPKNVRGVPDYANDEFYPVLYRHSERCRTTSL